MTWLYTRRTINNISNNNNNNNNNNNDDDDDDYYYYKQDERDLSRAKKMFIQNGSHFVYLELRIDTLYVV